MEVSVRLRMDRAWNGRSDLQAGVEMYYWEHPRILAHFEQPKRPPFGTPISPPRVVNLRANISLPTGTLDLFSSCTIRYESQVLPPTLCAIGLALAGRATRGNDAKFGDFGIMTPPDEPVVP